MPRAAATKGCTALAAVLAAAVLATCGSGEASISDKEGAQAVVLKVSGLPDGSTLAKKPLVPEQCNPVRYFQSYATAVEDPFGFLLPEAELLQTVGVFRNSQEARKAFDEITSKSARDCIGAQMQKFSRQEGGGRGELRAETVPRSLPGETTRAMRLVLASAFAVGEIERTAILHGRLMTTLTFISLNQRVSQDLWESVASSAADLVDETASSIES
jgi:hypothetical protein